MLLCVFALVDNCLSVWAASGATWQPHSKKDTDTRQRPRPRRKEGVGAGRAERRGGETRESARHERPGEKKIGTKVGERGETAVCVSLLGNVCLFLSLAVCEGCLYDLLGLGVSLCVSLIVCV